MTPCVLVRYGALGEVARFSWNGSPPPRGTAVVIETVRGLEVGSVLEQVKAGRVEAASPHLLPRTGLGWRPDDRDASDGQATAATGAVAVEAEAPADPEAAESWSPVLRLATADDQRQAAALAARAKAEFGPWCDRIAKWGLDLQLIDLEWMLDQSKLIVYVLAARGPDCTRLALHAATAGLGPIEVQPLLGGDGLATPAQPDAGGGCGTGGCGCHA